MQQSYLFCKFFALACYARKDPAMQPGQRISRYEILSLLGSGGMGEVWLARDAQLGRNVAVKVIHKRLAEDPDRLKRFLQEARAAAALTHPNIAQVHELCEEGPLPMIVMEYVQGRTLAERIREGVLPLDRILDIGIQSASALEEAHSKGLVHRDIKPGNIMLNARGHVKVLDFGVAKLVEGPGESTLTVEFTEPATLPGQVCGTLRYMSREQCTGGDLDLRSDIFSLGAVLYEMATGEPAFPGATSALVYDAILNRTSPPPSTLNSAIPPEFDKLIARALQKNPDHRHQSAALLRQDLEWVKSRTPGAPIRRPVPSRWRSYAIVVALVVLAAAVTWFGFQRQGSQAPLVLTATPLTSAQGTESQPSFSPDGNQVAFAWNGDNEENWDIYVKMVQGGPSLRLTNDPATDYSPAWSPDGATIAFLRNSQTEGSGFFLIPALGGTERKLSSASSSRTGVESPFLAWSPDGKQLAIADKKEPGEPMSIQLLDLTTGARRTLTTPPENTFGDSGIAWAPDGETVFFVRSNGMGIQDIYSVPSKGGEATRLTFDNRRIYGLSWNYADGRLLFASGRRDNARLWRLSPSGGEPQRILGIGDGASFLAVSRQRNRLAYTRSNVDTNVWRYSLDGQNPPVRLVSSTRLEQGPQYSPEGKRIVFASTRTGAWEIFTCNSDGQSVLQLTSFRDKPAGSPQWAPDGQHVAFDARPGGNADIYSLHLAGGSPVRITSHPAQDAVPSYSRDGRFIYFGSNRTGRFEIWKVPSGGGEAVQVTRNGGFYATESPDGRHLYYARALDQPGLFRMPTSGGAETLVLENLKSGYWGYRVVTASGIYYVVEEQVPDVGLQHWLYYHDSASGKSSKVLRFANRPFNAGLALSPDGKQILYTQADRSDTDILLVDGFR
ncbi:MAG: hypothetical protein FJW20_04225 [Acidimicrobiia bacterium]|nr:hypothetical protein [Acidimicrobiia bacterium]